MSTFGVTLGYLVSFEIKDRYIKKYCYLSSYDIFPNEELEKVLDSLTFNDGDDVSWDISENFIEKRYLSKNKVKIQNQEGWISFLKKLDVDNNNAYPIYSSIKTAYKINNIPKGAKIWSKLACVDTIEKKINNPNERFAYPYSVKLRKRVCRVKDLRVRLDADKELSISVSDSGQIKHKIDKVKRKVKNVYVSVKIEKSLYSDAMEAGVPKNVLVKSLKEHSFDVDFQRDVKKGDVLDLVFEEWYDEVGDYIHNGKLIYSDLKLSNKNNKIYLYNGDYYNSKGFSVKKAFMKTPLDILRITSRFGLRKHPVLGFSKMHTGIDFGAPTGARIYAVADGKVHLSKHDRFYGNNVIIKHNNIFMTRYGHMLNIDRRVKIGSNVKQGQVIGYVGSTGMATGPHLHFEVIKNGVCVDPAGLKFSSSKSVPKSELPKFKNTINEIDKFIAKNS